MTASDPVAPDRVLITCPACGASESTDAAVIADAPMIVCRECGGTWPAAPRRTKRRTPVAVSAPNSALVEAERRPFVRYSDGSDKAWIAKMEGDILPETARRRRLPMLAAAVAAGFFLATFFAGREAAVATLPDLAGLYGALGLAVNLDGLAIEDVTAERTSTADGDRLVVQGSIRNVGSGERTVPPLVATVHDSAMIAAGSHFFDSPARKIPGDEAVAFLLEIDSPPQKAAEVVVRFRRRGEMALTAAGEWAASGPAME